MNKIINRIACYISIASMDSIFIKHIHAYNLGILLSRIWLSSFFIYAGIGKIYAYSDTMKMMSEHDIPTFMLPLVILLELGGGLAIVFGFLTRALSIIMILYIIAATASFGLSGDLLYAELSWAGGFFLLMLTGAGRYSIDYLAIEIHQGMKA